jgi:hypothetical protein
MSRDKRIDDDADFIISTRYKNSLVKILERFPDGVPDKIGAGVLQMTVEDYLKEYNCGILKLRASMLPESEGDLE